MKKQGLMRPAQALAALLVVIAPCLAEKAMGEGSKAMDEGFCTTVTLNSSFYCAGLVANISGAVLMQLLTPQWYPQIGTKSIVGQ